jgi:hypothetical protein
MTRTWNPQLGRAGYKGGRNLGHYLQSVDSKETSISIPTRLSNLSCDTCAAGNSAQRLTASVFACTLRTHSRAAGAVRNGALSTEEMSTCGVGRCAFLSACAA